MNGWKVELAVFIGAVLSACVYGGCAYGFSTGLFMLYLKKT